MSEDTSSKCKAEDIEEEEEDETQEKEFHTKLPSKKLNLSRGEKSKDD